MMVASHLSRREGATYLCLMVKVIVLVGVYRFYFGDKFAAKICEFFVVYDDYVLSGVTYYRAGFG